MTKGFFKYRIKYVVLCAAVISAALAVFGDKGLFDIYWLTRERDGILEYNKSLEEENRGLEDKIRRLKADKRYIGNIARTELGMIGKDEVVYRFEQSAKQP